MAKDDLMVDARVRDDAAWMLRRAEQMHHPIASLIEICPTLDAADAYAVQCANVAQRIANGARVVGYKVGLSPSLMQRMIGVNELGLGHLLSDMRVEDGGTVAVSSLCRPRVEVTVAFVLGTALAGHDCTAIDVLAATDYVAAAIEVGEIDIGRPNPLAAQREPRRGGVVGHELDDADLPLLDPTVDDLDGRSDVVGSREHVDGGAVMSRKSA
ncbi:2-keto-4-pentenoate hydratase, partial [Mycobacterium sp. 1245852.3]|uniref:2-keto-4-pentenoate hydratase n=1 Tax=Mycobacterium sp. 1245852.3 TaxID=1856860 RepID=UPI0012E9B4D9